MTDFCALPSLDVRVWNSEHGTRPATPEHHQAGILDLEQGELLLALADLTWAIFKVNSLLKATTADTTPGYLDDKVEVESGVLLKTVVNPGADEKVRISIPDGGITNAKLASSYAAASHNHSGADITSGTVAVARLPEMGAASGGSGGAAGIVPASSAGDQTKFLRADATWAENASPVRLLGYSNPGSDQASISFTPTITAGTLKVMFMVSSSYTAGYDNFFIKFNNDSANHHWSGQHSSSGANGSIGSGTNAALAQIGFLLNSTGNVYTRWLVGEIVIWNALGTTKPKEFSCSANYWDAGVGSINIRHKGTYAGTSAISQLDFTMSNGNILADSWFKVLQVADS